MKTEKALNGLYSIRSWVMLAIMVGAYFLDEPVITMLYRPLKRMADLHMIEHGAMSLAPYSVLMLIRLTWSVALVGIVLMMLPRRERNFPIKDSLGFRRLMSGLLVGIAVMGGCILSIIAVGDATVTLNAQSLPTALAYSTGWLVFGMIGAAGEELYGRAAILLVAQRFVGWRGAVLVSGIMFFVIHLGNPGVSNLWLLRLFLQGMLLAYAVYRTQSIWWAIGYHTGWNWIGAPIFGSAGSGYLNQGHLFDFVPQGSELVTGGAVGPEGSVFAFVAMAAAFGVLVVTNPQRVKVGRSVRPSDRSVENK